MAAQATRAGVYFCRQAARCVAAVPPGTGGLGGSSSLADGGLHRFVVGTCSLSQPNSIHLVEFSEDTSEVVCHQVLPHSDEVWLLSVSPNDAGLLMTYTAGRSQPALRLWRVGGDPDALELAPLASLADDDGLLLAVKTATWDPHSEGNIMVADADAVHVFQGTPGGGPRFTRLVTLQVGQKCAGACFDPHHPNQVSTVDDTHLKTWDLRASRMAFKQDNAHLFGARDVDYNPNVPYQVLTTGEDAALRFWDLRMLGRPLRTLFGGHHHWVTRARYNGHHDQLVVSCGTDSGVCLWRAGSVASSPLGAAADEAGDDAAEPAPAPPPDGLIRRCEEHEDSVYSCCWSAADAWVFASVSYDGKLAVNRVPGEEKYRILL